MPTNTNTVVAMTKCKQNIQDLKEEEFAEFWQKRECLYTFSSQFYHDRTKVDVAWKDIEDEL